ncbi:hypothetical protein M0805_007732 [Coniferiporia weirii]|nr:hypothetical protein M0805_007732 [Coniferiporia weirii]
MLSTRSGVEPIDPSELQPILSLYTDYKYVQVAIATALCYDTITTFDKEIKYFWSSPRKTSSIVYFLNRYIGIIAILTHVMGRFSVWAGDLGDWMTIILIDYILLMRVLALWSGAKKLAICLKAFFAVDFAFMLGIWITIVTMEKPIVGAVDGFAFCGSDSALPPLFESLYWAAPLFFELILMILALYKAASLWRESAGFEGIGLAKVLIYDQAIYFVIVMMCGIGNITFSIADLGSPTAAVNIVEQIVSSTTIPCIIGCRLLVHLNEAAERGSNGGTSYKVQTVSDMQFV